MHLFNPILLLFSLSLSLIWMFCTRKFNLRLNRVHEGALKRISEDCTSSFSDLVTLLNEKPVHQKCINFVMEEVFKYLNGLSPSLMNKVCRLKLNYYNLGIFNQFETYISKTKSLDASVTRTSQL